MINFSQELHPSYKLLQLSKLLNECKEMAGQCSLRPEYASMLVFLNAASALAEQCQKQAEKEEKDFQEYVKKSK